jgi:hypothetical protein
MGITVEEYFARKKACSDCVEHENEEHCVTHLLSRAENCLVYNIIRMGIGEYTEQQRKTARELRNSLSEEKLVDYYVRSENIITGIGLLDKIVFEKHKEQLSIMVENMLSSLEQEYNISKENKWLSAQS